jgi:hypothetical protein
MSYLNAMAALANPVGAAPPSRASQMGPPPNLPAPQPVPAQPHVQPAPYDVMQDPGWRGLISPDHHEMRNFISGLSPEERQMLLQWATKLGSPIPATSRVPGNF